MVLECLLSIDENDGDLLTVSFLELGIGFYVDDLNGEGYTPTHTLDDSFGLMAEVAVGTGINFNLDGIVRHWRPSYGRVRPIGIAFRGRPAFARRRGEDSEEPLGAGDIQDDLLPERLGRGELHFVSEPV